MATVKVILIQTSHHIEVKKGKFRVRSRLNIIISVFHPSHLESPKLQILVAKQMWYLALFQPIGSFPCCNSIPKKHFLFVTVHLDRLSTVESGTGSVHTAVVLNSLVLDGLPHLLNVARRQFLVLSALGLEASLGRCGSRVGGRVVAR
jgi:hypothetical protein